ncbi:MAG: hypothetical protein U0935_07520 [Pirellulales bacterium]
MNVMQERGSLRSCGRRARGVRRGAASLDYVLVMGVVLPLVAIVYWAGPRMMNLVYEMTSVLMGWPFQ